MDLASLTDDEFESHLRPLWNFLLAPDEPIEADAIFVFGGIDLHVPDRAAELYKAGHAPRILVTGNSGEHTAHHFTGAEAEIFSARMIECGIPENVIIKELRATNTGLNVQYGMAKLCERLGATPSRLLVVARSFLTKRCKATFEKQFPDVTIVGCSPDGNMLDFTVSTRAKFAARLAAEIDRLDAYAREGHIAPVAIPDTIRKISNSLA